MRTLMLVAAVLSLAETCPGQMTAHYDSYTTYSVDTNLVISQTVLVEGYTTTASGTCNTTCCQSTPYPPYYYCQSCPIPGCSTSTHTLRINNVIGGAGGWSSSSPGSPFTYQSFQTTSQVQGVVGQDISSSSEGQAICSVSGTILDVIFLNDVKISHVKVETLSSTEIGGGAVKCRTASWCTPQTEPGLCNPPDVTQQPLLPWLTATCSPYYNTWWLAEKFLRTSAWVCIPLFPGESAFGTTNATRIDCTTF
jgi:hypothetical protein